MPVASDGSIVNLSIGSNRPPPVDHRQRVWLEDLRALLLEIEELLLDPATLLQPEAETLLADLEMSPMLPPESLRERVLDMRLAAERQLERLRP